MEGDQTKIREALEFVHDKLLTWNYTDKATAKMAVAVVDRCSKALAIPPRQCDVGTAEEQFKRYHKFCMGGHGCSKCRVGIRSGAGCSLAWAQMPYEGDEKGEKNEHD